MLVLEYSGDSGMFYPAWEGTVIGVAGKFAKVRGFWGFSQWLPIDGPFLKLVPVE